MSCGRFCNSPELSAEWLWEREVVVRSPLGKSGLDQSSNSGSADASFTPPNVVIQGSQSLFPPGEYLPDYLAKSLPCVLYECTATFELTYVSENISDLLGLESSELLGNRLLSDERIPLEDLILLSNKVAELGHLNKKTALVHRILNKRGLPFWVAHNLWKASVNDTTVIRGCIIPMDYNGRLSSSEQTVISRFVHKIGNHFQLLNLVVNSLRRTVSESKEILMLQETVEKAIELTRSFSEYNQTPTCLSRIGLKDIIQAAAVARRSLFETKGITFVSQMHPSLDEATILADPYLLELAIGYILQNALEATEAGGQVTLQAKLKCSGDSAPVASIAVIDSGCGIAENTMGSVTLPFFSSKKNHDGLGLSMASRFIEIHGGILRMTSAEGKGTEVEVILPIASEGHPLSSELTYP
jgi:signal transduction histidine kinase